MSIARVRYLRTGLWLCCACAANAAMAATPCSGQAPVVELAIVATALAPDSDRTLAVRVFGDGCAHVHKPAFRRDAGDYRVDLDAAALETLRGDINAPALRNFDAKRLRAELTATERKRLAADSAAPRYSDVDADHYALRWNSGTKSTSATWPGVPESAKRHPEQAALQALHRVTSVLQALAERGDAQRIAGAQP
jgi:hypothetical protein